MMDIFHIPPQCCDAKHYLAMGEACAIDGDCYNILRPMGAVYWFSIPYRFNLPQDTLIFLHYLLAIASIILSAFVIKKLISTGIQKKSLPNLKLFLPLVVISMLIHGIFLYPIISHSMSDLPSSLLFLIAIWLLFLLPEKILPKLFILFVCGLLLGLAAWIRSFFLYPLLFALVFWMLHTAFTRKLQLHKIILLVALIPIAFQFYTTWKKTGALSYIHPSEASIHQGFILAEKASGYDTVLPGVGFRTYPACQNYRALGEALQTVDFYSLGCLLSGKLHYYLGSYSPDTFWDPDHTDIVRETAIDLSLSEDLSEANPVRSTNIKKESITSASRPEANDVVKFWKEDNRYPAEIAYMVEFREGSKYFPSLEAWTDENYQVILFSVRSQQSNEDIYSTFGILNETPQLFDLGISNHNSGKYDLVITFPFIDPRTNADAQKIISAGGTINHGSFFVKDIKLGEAEFKRERYWFPGILVANLLGIFSAIALIYKKRRDWSSEHRMAFLLILLCCAEALIITPEQRFIIAPMITFWILCVGFISRIILLRFSRPIPHGSL